VGNLIYVVGGMSGDGARERSVEEFDVVGRGEWV